jgi:hypothetical protein
MEERDKRTKYLATEGVPLPMHMSMMEEMSTPTYSTRFSKSRTARSDGYICIGFYKSISRSLPLDVKEEPDYDRRG